MRVIGTFFCLLFCALTVNANAQNLELPDSLKGFKKVPVVEYTPLDFGLAVSDAFKFTETQDYYLISRDRVYSYDRMPYDKFRRATYQDRKLYLNKYPANIAKFGDVIMENDNCFFLYFHPILRFDNRFLGIKNGDNLTFVDVDGHEYNSLEELVIAMSRENSLDSFYNSYIGILKNNIYFYSSGFYEVKSKEEAIVQLRSDYNLKNLNTLDEMEMIDNLINQLQQIIPSPEGNVDDLAASLKLFLSESQEKPYSNRTIDMKLRTTSINFIPLRGLDVSSVLKPYYSDDEYKMLSEKLAINRARSNFAIDYLANYIRKIKEELAGDVIVTGFGHDRTAPVLAMVFGDGELLD